MCVCASYALKRNLHTLRAIIMNCKQEDYEKRRYVQTLCRVHRHFWRSGVDIIGSLKRYYIKSHELKLRDFLIAYIIRRFLVMISTPSTLVFF